MKKTTMKSRFESFDAMLDHVFETATSDKGMTARYTALFHLHNPNGAYPQCRDAGWKAYEVGSYELGPVAGDWDREKLQELADMDKPRWWNVRYHVDSLKEEAQRWNDKVK